MNKQSRGMWYDARNTRDRVLTIGLEEAFPLLLDRYFGLGMFGAESA